MQGDVSRLLISRLWQISIKKWGAGLVVSIYLFSSVPKIIKIHECLTELFQKKVGILVYTV